MTILWVLIIVLLVVIIALVVALLRVISKATYLSKKDIDFVSFAIKMYIAYAEEFNIGAGDKHEYLVEQLERIKKDSLGKEK